MIGNVVSIIRDSAEHSFFIAEVFVENMNHVVPDCLIHFYKRRWSARRRKPLPWVKWSPGNTPSTCTSSTPWSPTSTSPRGASRGCRLRMWKLQLSRHVGLFCYVCHIGIEFI